MTVVQVPPAHAEAMWPRVVGQVEAALVHSDGCYRAEDVRAAIAAGEWQLWTDGHSIACTRVAEYPARRVLFIVLASGGKDSVAPIWEALERFGRANRCKAINWMGRPGWRRSGFLPEGWRHTHDVMVVELGDE